MGDQGYDFAIVGSGFGGSVSAMRLAQKGYRVILLEAGKRFRPHDYARTNWHVHRFFWLPRLRFFGPQCITFLKGVMILHGKGVGGGSNVYANTLMIPNPEVFRSGDWPASIDWAKELAPHFETAGRMLGRTRNPHLSEADEALRLVGDKMGISHTFEPTDVAVYFGKAGETTVDPYFSGKGPDRTGCTLCGGCMVGCRHGAKNTLETNYLHFARLWGARILAETTVTRIVPAAGGKEGYELETKQTTSWLGRKGETVRAAKVILAAGALGSTELLLRNRNAYRTLPRVSSRLGHMVRTNGESIVGVTSFDEKRNFSTGIAIGASLKADSVTTIEAVRYPEGNGVMRLLCAPLTPNGTPLMRPLKMLGVFLRRLPRMARLVFLVSDWARSSVILLVMRSSDHKMRLSLGRSLLSPFSLRLRGVFESERLPCYLETAQQAALHLADEIEGEPQNAVSEALLSMNATAHILGGACLGDDESRGVTNPDHEVFGYPGLYVCDGSVVPGNLGVNPSFAITALAERFASRFPPKPGVSDSLLQERKISFGAAQTKTRS